MRTCSEWSCYPRRNYSKRQQRKCNLEAIEIDPIESPVWGNLLRRRKDAAPAANRFGIFYSCIGCTRTSPLRPRLDGSGTTQRRISFDSSHSAVVQRPVWGNPPRCRNRCSARANKCCMSNGCTSKRPFCPPSVSSSAVQRKAARPKPATRDQRREWRVRAHQDQCCGMNEWA